MHPKSSLLTWHCRLLPKMQPLKSEHNGGQLSQEDLTRLHFPSMRASHVTDEVATLLQDANRPPCRTAVGSVPLSRASEVGRNSYVGHPGLLCRNEALSSHCKHRRNKPTYAEIMAVLHFAHTKKRL